jgi:hypothetical protein
MKSYANVDGDSNVTAYEYGDNWIRVKFSDGSIYEYTHSSAGQHNIDTMKRLADSGDGLNSFIMRNVKKSYSRKI